MISDARESIGASGLAPDGVETNRDNQRRNGTREKGMQRHTTGGYGLGGGAELGRLVEVVQGKFLLEGGTLVCIEVLGVGFTRQFTPAIRKQRGRGVRRACASSPEGDGHDPDYREHAQYDDGEIDLHHAVSRSRRLALSRSSDAVSLAAPRRATRIRTKTPTTIRTTGENQRNQVDGSNGGS